MECRREGKSLSVQILESEIWSEMRGESSSSRKTPVSSPGHGPPHTSHLTEYGALISFLLLILIIIIIKVWLCSLCQLQSGGFIAGNVEEKNSILRDSWCRTKLQAEEPLHSPSPEYMRYLKPPYMPLNSQVGSNQKLVSEIISPDSWEDAALPYGGQESEGGQLQVFLTSSKERGKSYKLRLSP